MAAGYRFEVAGTRDALEALEAEWRALYARTRPRNPFTSFDWGLAGLEKTAPQAMPYILSARREGRLVGLAPMRLHRNSGFRVLRFLAPACSEFVGFLLDPEHPAVEAALLGELAARRGEWDLLLLRKLTDSYTGLHRPGAHPGLRSVIRR